LSGQAGRYDLNYSHDGLDNYFQLAAQRCGDVLVVSFTDTADHERSAVEIALRENQARERAARAEAEAQRGALQQLFEQAPVAIAVTRGSALVVDFANSVMLAMWGKTGPQALHRPLFEAVPEVVGQGYEGILAQVLRTGEAVVVQEQPAQLLRQGEPVSAYFTFTCQAMRDAQGQVTGGITVSADVTEQVLAGRQVQHLNDELAAANAGLAAAVAARTHELQAANAGLSTANQQLLRTNTDLDTFVYTASHDLKAPITNIEGLLHALREELPAAVLQSDHVTPMLDRMQRAVERFNLTIAQLTDVSRLQQADTHPTEAVDLVTIVEDVRLDLAAGLATAGTRLTVDVGACPSLLFAAKHLRSIVYNLLSNAVKYRHPARPPVVHLRCHGTPTAILLEVTDNGLGLSEAQQAKLFSMFQRLYDHVEGSGIGLYMVKRIVENAGGTIAVRSQPGTGSTFTVTLPVPAPESGP